MHDDADTRAYSLDDLGRAIRECAEHLADQPWGARPQMFALVPTAVLAETDPSLLHALDDAGLTVVEQQPLHEDLDQHPEALEEIVAGTRWPATVVGAVLVREVTVLPPGADPSPDVAATHPARRTGRMFAAALRDGRGVAMLQLAENDEDSAGAADTGFGPEIELLHQPGMGEDLIDLVRASLEESEPDY